MTNKVNEQNLKFYIYKLEWESTLHVCMYVYMYIHVGICRTVCVYST